jgi:hypothetical protein
VTDFYRDQYEYWFADACRKAELIGGITGWVQATRADTTDRKITPAKAIARITKLLADFDAETLRQQPGGTR